MTAAVNALQKTIAAQNDAANGKLDASSSQVQALNDSVDELKSRIAKLDKSIQDLQAQLQNVQNPPQTGASSAAPIGSAPVAGPPMSGNQTPPLKETLQAGVRDYNAAKLPAGRYGRGGAVLPWRDCLPREQVRRCGKGL
jgi:uncharacterized small protein (DUF1192 family)